MGKAQNLLDEQLNYMREHCKIHKYLPSTERMVFETCVTDIREILAAMRQDFEALMDIEDRGGRWGEITDSPQYVIIKYVELVKEWLT